MKIRMIVLAGMAAGAAVLAVSGCSRTAEAVGEGQEYRGGRYAEPAKAEEPAARGGRWLGAASATGDQPGGALVAAGPAADRTARDAVQAGELGNLAGTLRHDGAEWYLDAEDGSYLLHLGNPVYLERTGIKLRQGAAASVRGFRDGKEVSVVSMELGGKTYVFRSEDGRPLWAGGGNSAGTSRGGGRGGGQARTSGNRA
jgi:hypothetical protein